MEGGTGKVACWRLRLFECEFDVVHRLGIRNQAPDALSLLETFGTDDSVLEDKVPVLLCESASPMITTFFSCFVRDGINNLEESITEVLSVEQQEDNNRVPFREEVVKAQSTDRLCRQMALTVGHP